MKLIGLIRIGRDAEMRYTADGTPVVSISGAWNHGRKGDDGRRPTQWAEFALFGQRAESLVEYLKKGKQFEVCADEVRIETYPKTGGGEGVKLCGRILTIDFCDSPREEGGQERQAPAPAPRNRAPAAAPRPARDARQPGSFDGEDDGDIPF